MTLLSQIIQYAISGITSGSIYAVIGICWSVVYLITKVLNFTTGEFVMLGGMLTWGFHAAGLGLFPASVLAVAATVCIAVVMERAVVRSVRYPTARTYMMLTIALGHARDQLYMTVEAFKKVDPKLDPDKPADLVKIREQLRDNLEKIKGFVGQNGVFNYTPDNHNGLGPKCYIPVVVEGGKWRMYKSK
jgi:branched-subunit amino acid ABC-type transport system permease component